ncbi:hypothetical protein ACLIA0_03595 [Bacillaceae bacterium W0354]
MSERKKEIHVKDLVIKAENVIFEPQRREVDPFLGRRRHLEEVDSNQEEREQERQEKKENDNNRENRIPPFFRL